MASETSSPRQQGGPADQVPGHLPDFAARPLRGPVALTLFIARGLPSASRAIANLQDALEDFGIGLDSVEIVDVFTEPERAVQAELLVTPALRAEVFGHDQWLVGDFGRLAGLHAWLARVVGHSEHGQSPHAV